MKKFSILFGLLILFISFVPAFAANFQAEIENVPTNLTTIHDVPFDVTFDIYNPVSDPITNAGAVDEYGDPIGTVILSELKDQIQWTFDPPCDWVTDGLTHTVSFYLEDDTHGYTYPDVMLYTSTLIVTAGDPPEIIGDCGATIVTTYGHTALANFDLSNRDENDQIWWSVEPVMIPPFGNYELVDGVFSFSPCPEDEGFYIFTIVATDCTGSYGRCNFTVEIISCCPIYYHDPNGDGNVDILDVVFIINYKYKEGPAPAYPPSADWDLDGDISILDAVYIVNFKYKDGPYPKHDYSHCTGKASPSRSSCL